MTSEAALALPFPSLAGAQHVEPSLNGGWRVRRHESARASRIFSSHAEAVRYARAKAKKERTDLFLHRRDFTIEEMDSYRLRSDSLRTKR
jgi:hypothetical protein